MQQQITSRTAAALILTAGLAACGGGGSSSAPVPTAQSTGAPQAGQRENATFTFTIPQKSTNAKTRTPRYISPSTASIQIAVSGPGSATGTAELDVTATSCPNSVCSMTVSAPVGSDTFTITTYDAAGGSGGSGHVLSTATQAATVVLHAANAFNFTLGGVTASVKVTLANPNLPTAAAGSTTATIQVLDAAGNQIVGTYQSPVTLGAGDPSVTLGKTSFADSSTTSSAVSFTGASRAAVTITATDGTHTGTTSLIPTSNIVWLTIPGAQIGDGIFHIIEGPDGKLYYGDLGQTSVVSLASNFLASYLPGRIGVIDPAMSQITEYPIGYTRSGAANIGADPIKLAFRPGTNDLYIAAQESGSIERIANATTGGLAAAAGASSTSLVDLALLPRPANGNVTPNVTSGDATPRSFDFSADGSTLYVGTYGGHALAIVPVATFGAATPTYVTLAARSKRTQGVVDLNGKVWFVESSSAYRLIAGMSESNTALSGVQEYADTAIPTSYLPNFRHMTAGQDGNLYLTWSGDGTAPTSLHMFNPTTQTFTALPGPGALPFFPDAIQRSNVAGSTALVFNDLQGLNVGIHDTSTHATTLYPAYTSVTPPVNYANDVVQTTPNDLWLTGTPGYGPDGGTYITPPLIGHIALAAGWSIFPRLTGTMPIYGTGDPNAFLFAIAQSPGSGDTFTVASSATSICTVSTIANYPGDYKVTGVAPGTCTVTVTDQRSRHETLAFQVTTQTATINARARKLQ